MLGLVYGTWLGYDDVVGDNDILALGMLDIDGTLE